MWRVFVTVGILFCGGVLAAANIIVGKKPNAKELIDKLVPYGGWIGIVMFFWGIWDLLYMFDALKLISLIPVTVIVIVLATITELVLGFMLGFSLISKYALSKNEAALAKGQEIRAKLAKFQGPFGIIAILVAVYILIANLFHIAI